LPEMLLVFWYFGMLAATFTVWATREVVHAQGCSWSGDSKGGAFS
jgi:hypothetical protein